MKTQFNTVMGKTTEAEQIKYFELFKNSMDDKIKFMAVMKTNIDDLRCMVGRL